MPKAIEHPRTLRELGDMAGDSHTFMRLLDELGPWPMPPTGYTMAKDNDDRWTGNDVVNRAYIITPVWTASTNSRSIDLWVSREPGESDANLSPLEALELAAHLATLASDALRNGAE